MEDRTKIRLVSLASIISFLLALYIFGYATDKHGIDKDDFTISRAIAEGNGISAGIIVFVVLGTGLLLFLQHLREFPKLYYARIAILVTVMALFISLIFVTPYQKDGTVSSDSAINDAHIGIAASAFILLLVFNLITYYILYKNYREIMPIILAVFNILVFIALFIPVIVDEKTQGIFSGQTEENDLGITFATFENINYLSLMVIILLLGFYKV